MNHAKDHHQAHNKIRQQVESKQKQMVGVHKTLIYKCRICDKQLHVQIHPTESSTLVMHITEDHTEEPKSWIVDVITTRL